MQGSNPVTGLAGWIWHRLTANYWSLAVGAVVLAPLFFLATLHFDRGGMTIWLIREDLAPVATADTARDLAGIIASIDAAFITLYYSISLLVLTIAAGNLGVRLIDRWLAKRLVRITIAGLSFTLIYAVLTMAAIDSEAALAETPLFCFAMTVAFLLLNIAMLAVALHDLGRTMFVDRAIDKLARDGVDPYVRVVGASPYAGDFAHEAKAPCNGYVEGVDIDALRSKLAENHGVVRVCVAPGQHVFEGQTIARMETSAVDSDFIRSTIAIGPFRSDSQGAVFQIRLLVEIAARAMSPAVNDFWTAMAAADAISEILAGHRENWVDDGLMPVHHTATYLELPGQDFRGLFKAPLDSFRQAAADYPSVTIRMIGNIAHLLDQLEVQEAAPGLRDFLNGYASQLAEHGQSRAQIEKDKSDIAAALQGVQRRIEARAA